MWNKRGVIQSGNRWDISGVSKEEMIWGMRFTEFLISLRVRGGLFSGQGSTKRKGKNSAGKN